MSDLISTSVFFSRVWDPASPFTDPPPKMSNPAPSSTDPALSGPSLLTRFHAAMFQPIISTRNVWRPGSTRPPNGPPPDLLAHSRGPLRGRGGRRERGGWEGGRGSNTDPPPPAEKKKPLISTASKKAHVHMKMLRS
jgi:hypothetical protein